MQDCSEGDIFKARVEKAFGSLSTQSPSTQNPLWSLTHGEVEKKEWNRSKLNSSRDDDVVLCSSSFDRLLRDNRRNRAAETFPPDNSDDDDETRGEVWDIKSSIGLDSTLDYEDEEDEYDRVAEGRKDTGGCLYMSDVTIDGEHQATRPYSVGQSRKDPRANHFAAKIRLKEDAAEAQEHDALFGKLKLEAQDNSCKASEDNFNMKPILKRKENLDDARPRSLKRVKFLPGCEASQEGAGEKHQNLPSVSSSHGADSPNCQSLPDEESKPRVPDYVLNPSKYTRYSLDSAGEVNEDSNRQACKDFLQQVKCWKSKLSDTDDTPGVLPKSVTFIPRQKARDALGADASGGTKGNGEYFSDSLVSPNYRGLAVGIAALDDQQDEDRFEDDGKETNVSAGMSGFRKPGRQYRGGKLKSEDSLL